MKEEWKDIPGYEGLYQASNLGNIRSLNYHGRKGHIQVMQNGYAGVGYQQIHLRKDGKTKHHYIHRLIALTFIPNPNNYKEVNHIDEDKNNNRVDNLEWCTRKHNINYGNRNAEQSRVMKG